ncbi:MAG: PKD domain-containing protein [Candidatus Thermoplasmatota archaeon]|nr:PKD domain-containing protein [Candidatus Thermoplasmatota archaeon]
MRYSRSVLSIVVLLSLITSSFLVMGTSFQYAASGQDLSTDPDDPSPPSRLIVKEKENNGAWTSANQIPGTSNSRYELHGNISGPSDFDYFKINLIGGGGPVDMFTISPNWFKMTSGTDFVVVWISAFYPDTNSENIILVNFYDEDQSYIFWRDMSFYASYSGMYGFKFEPYNYTTGTNGIKGNMEYNFTISISSQNPRDNTNDEGSSQQLSAGTGTISTDVYVARDMMDWYKISAPDPLHPTRLDLQVSLNSPNPDQTLQGIYYGVELDVFIKYNTRSNPGSFQTELHRISVGKVFQDIVGCAPSPKKISLEKNCTEMYIGIVIRSYGINPSSPAGRSYLLMTEGMTSYAMNYDISANIPNKRPQLMDAAVDRTIGKSSDIFGFSVIYRDIQNESARFVELWKNGAPFKMLAPDAESGENYVTGVRYETEVLGSQIGSDGDYHFNISASDGKDIALDLLSGIGIFNVRIDNNLPPQSNFGERFAVRTTEDSAPVWIVLDNVFTDPDMDPLLTYSMLHGDGIYKGYQYTLEGEGFEAELINNGTELAPEWRLVVEPAENVNGQIEVVVNATDNAVFSRSAEVTFVLDIRPVNDPPVIKRVGSVDTTKFKTAEFYNLEQGEMEELSIIAEDIDGGDILKFTWNIGEVLSSARRGKDYDWNQSKGDIWFTTTDGDVPGFDTIVTVSDGKGGSDSVLVTFEIENINDPPTIKVPAFKSTIEGEYLYINPTYGDPDIDSGDIISFTYSMGELERVTPSTAIDFSQTTGRLVLKAVSDEMNGEWEVNITVVDLYGLADWGICRIIIDNVNDPPVAYPINYEQFDEDLTVIFHTLAVQDEDKDDIHTYIWDFGDGSDGEEGENIRDVTHTFPGAGAYTVTLTVFDGESHSEVKEVIVTVTAPPIDPDPDVDGMTTEWETKFGLDPHDPSDAEMDYDGDGLTNLQEFEYYQEKEVFINPWNPDTDGDGYDDGEEVRKNYDPTDADHYPEDPNKDISFLLWLGVVVVISLMVLAAVTFMVLKLRNRPKAYAVPMVPPVQTYSEITDGGYYEQIPAASFQQLPPGPGDQISLPTAQWPTEEQNQYWQSDPEYLPEGPHEEGALTSQPAGDHIEGPGQDRMPDQDVPSGVLDSSVPDQDFSVESPKEIPFDMEPSEPMQDPEGNKLPGPDLQEPSVEGGSLVKKLEDEELPSPPDIPQI